MKRRVVKKVEKMMVVEKLCQLQQEIDEHERFLGDLMIMLITDNPDHKALAVDLIYTNEIWRRVQKLMQDNRKLAQSLKEKEA